MDLVFRYCYFVVCFAPMLLLPATIGPMSGRGIWAVVIIMFLSPLLTFFGVVLAALTPRGSKIGPMIATIIAALPGVYVWLFAGR